MEKKRMTTKEKLALMDQIKERNEQRRQEFAEQEAAKKAREEKLLDMYLEGHITKEQLYKRIKE